MALGIFLGWILSLVSTLVTFYFVKSNKKAEFCNGLKSEIIELRYILAVTRLIVGERLGRIDVELLKWLKGHLQSYVGAENSENIENYVSQLLETSDENLETYVKTLIEQGSDSFVVPTIASPFIAGSYPLVSTLSAKLQFYIFSSHRKIVGINEKFKRMEYWDGETFKYGDDKANYNRAVNNSKLSAESAFFDLKIAADHLEQAEEHLSSSKVFLGVS